jgi:hypothetical protein
MSDQQEQGLILGDRINFPYILANSILKFHEAIGQPEGSQSEQEVRERALLLFNSLPDAWIIRDKELSYDLSHVHEEIETDGRREFMGRKIGKPKIRVEKLLQPYRLYNSCINVFQRRGLLSKTVYSENLVPTPESVEEKENDDSPLSENEIKEITKIKDKINSEK